MNKQFKEKIITNIRNVLDDSNWAENFNHQGLKGRSREIFLTNLIKPMLSPNIEISSGTIIDSHEGQSRQIDIIIYDRSILPPILLNSEEGIIPIEAVLSTIEVKSSLNKTELNASVNNARSIKRLRPHFYEMNGENNQKNSTACYLFAFNSDLSKSSELDRLKKTVEELNVSENQEINIPISGLCVAKKKYFTYCKTISPDINFAEHHYIEDREEEIVLDFIINLINTTNALSAQRSPIFLTQYFRNVIGHDD